MWPNYSALDWEHPFEFHVYFYWPELKIFHYGLRLCVLFLALAEWGGYCTCSAHRCLFSAQSCSPLRCVRKYHVCGCCPNQLFQDASISSGIPNIWTRSLWQNYMREGDKRSQHKKLCWQMGRNCCLWAVAVLLLSPGAAVVQQHFGLQPYLVPLHVLKKCKWGLFC